MGPITALCYVLIIEDPTRFEKSRTVGAYLGLVPKRKQSEDTAQREGITKAGDETLRRLLVEAAQYILGPFGEDCDLRRWGLRLAEEGAGVRTEASGGGGGPEAGGPAASPLDHR